MYGVSPRTNVASVYGLSIFLYCPSVFSQVYLYNVIQGSLNHTANNSLQFVRVWHMIHYVIILEKQRMWDLWFGIKSIFSLHDAVLLKGASGNCVRGMKYTKPHTYLTKGKRLISRERSTSCTF